MLGGVPVVHGDDHRVAAHAQITAQRFVGDGVAPRPAAAVEIHDDWVRPRRRRPIQPVGQLARRARQGAVNHFTDLGTRLADLSHADHDGTGLLHGHGFERGQVERRDLLEHHLRIGLQAAHHTVVALHAARARHLEAQIVACHHFVTGGPVEVHTGGVGHEHPRLTRDVSARVPRIGLGEKGYRRAVVEVLHPPGLGGIGGLDPLEVVGAQVGQRVADEVHVLLDRHRHVRQHRRAARTGDEEQVGEAGRGQPEIGGRPCGPLVLQRQPVGAPDVDRRQRAGERVEAGGEDDRVQLEGFPDDVDPGLGDPQQRLRAQVDQPHVRGVECGVVVGVEAQPFGADGKPVRAQQFSGVRVVHGAADLGADELREFVVGGRIAQHVGVEVENLQQFAELPGAFVMLLAFGHTDRERRRLGALDRHTAGRGPCRLAVGRLVGHPGEFLVRERTVVRRDGKARRALEDDQLLGLCGDERDRLDARRSGTDHRDPLAGEVHRIVGPVAGEVHLAREPLEAADVGLLGYGQASGGHHQMAATDLVAAVGADPPCRRRVVPVRLRDPGAERDVAAQVELVRDVVEVSQDFRLGGVLLRPLPVAPPVGVEAEHVVDAGNVDACARVTVPVPGAAEVVRGLENAHAQTLAAETVHRVQPGESGADDDDIDVDIDVMVPCHQRSSG